MLTERPQNDKVPKNFLVLNLAPAADPAAPKTSTSQSAQPDVVVQRRAAAQVSAEL